VQLEGLGKLKNPVTSGNLACNLLTCSIVTQDNTKRKVSHRNNRFVKVCVLWDEILWLYTPGYRLTSLPSPDNKATLDNLCPRHLGPFHDSEMRKPE
jgi:hypothetical protein